MRTLMLLVLLALFGGAAYFWLQAGDSLPVPAAAGAVGDASAVVGEAAHRPPSGQDPATTAGNEREDVAATLALSGRLLQNGGPLAGVTVIACKGNGIKAQELDRAVTDRDGWFRFIKAGDRFWLTADGASVPHHWRSRWIDALDGPADVVVVAPGSIAGVVRDAAGAAIVGAKLTRVIAAHKTVSVGPPVALTTISDEHGQFRFERVAKEQGKLRCQAVGYQMVPDHEVEIDVGEDAVTEIVMRPGMTLRGLVMDYVGHPLKGAKVTTEDAQETLTDASGQFTIEDFRRYADIDILASGHLPHQIEWLDNTRELQRVKLERAVTLRGVVIGSNNQPGFVYVERSDKQRADASDSWSDGVLHRKLDIVRDGRFELPGFALADFDVTVRIPGVGVSEPVRVELREDSEVEFTVVPQRAVTVSVYNATGELIQGAKMVRDGGIVRAPKRYGVTGAALVKLVFNSYQKQKPVPIPGGMIELGVPVGEGVAFYVHAPGYLRTAAAAVAAALPERIDVVMLQAGSVRGIVHGGTRMAYAGQVSVTEMDAVGNEIVKAVPGRDGSLRKVVASALINQHGTFVIGNIVPGRYRAQVSRSNTRTIERESQGVPLIDGRHDARATTDFVVEAGNETNLELTEPPLGRLIGRVLSHGAPIVGAMIVASRPVAKGPAKRTWSRYGRTSGERYWDDLMWLADASGQRSGKGGEFAFLYRDAGPVEVRVRHVDGLTTSRAFVVPLPEPGADVVRDFEIPVGEIRGRYPFTKLDGAACKSFTVTLFPADMTRHDPFFMPHHGGSLARECPKIENSPDGGFAFRYLRSGRWLVRAHHSGNVLLWQKLIDVHNDVVDLGDLPAMPPVAASVKWAFVAEQPVKVLGVWLRVPQAQGQSPIWAGTFSASKGQAACSVMPGKYLVSAFGWRAVVPDGGDSFGIMSIGLTGELLTKPVPIEVHADGSVTPKSLAFTLIKVAGK